MTDISKYLEAADFHLKQAERSLNEAVTGLTWAEKFEARMRLAEAYSDLAVIGRQQDAGSTP